LTPLESTGTRHRASYPLDAINLAHAVGRRVGAYFGLRRQAPTV